MWLVRNLKAFGGWALSISRQIVRIAPGSIAALVFATLVSQLSRLFAFLLPLKIVILIGSTGVPRYFPSAFLAIERETLVIILGIATACFYVMHLLAEKTIDICSERAADLVLARADKLALFANQDDIARNACRKLAQSIAGLIFAGLALTLIGFLHPSVAVLLLAWLTGALALAALGGSASSGFRAWLEENSTQFANGTSATGFFAVTALIIIEFIAGFQFNILFAVVSLLLSRQVMSHLGRVVTNALTLDGLKPFINALFLRGHLRLTSREMAKGNDVWKLLDPGQPERWLPDALSQATGRRAETATLTVWHQTGFPDVLALEAKAEGECGGDYLVKLFGSGRDMIAAHEIALLAAIRPGHLPAPQFLGMVDVEGNNGLVFEGMTGAPLKPGEWPEARLAITGECWACELPRDLVLRFRRSHRLLHARLSTAPVDRLSLVTTEPRELTLISRFIENLDTITQVLESLPLAIYNPDLLTDTIFRMPDGRAVAIQWGRWTLEPLGAGWPTNKTTLLVADKWLSQVQKKRPEIRRVTADQIRLSALLFAFEKQVTGQRYRTAIGMLPQILAAVDSVGILPAAKVAS